MFCSDGRLVYCEQCNCDKFFASMTSSNAKAKICLQFPQSQQMG